VPKYAGWLLNYAEEVQQTHGHLQLRRCGPQVQHALELTGHAANRICAQRLIPMLLASLESHEHIQISEQCHWQRLCAGSRRTHADSFAVWIASSVYTCFVPPFSVFFRLPLAVRQGAELSWSFLWPGSRKLHRPGSSSPPYFSQVYPAVSARLAVSPPGDTRCSLGWVDCRSMQFSTL
jgi:hypothetical protein